MGDCVNKTKARQILGYTGTNPSAFNEFTKEDIGYIIFLKLRANNV